MSALSSCIYRGHVVHRRIRPKVHRLSYRVFALCVDVDELEKLGQHVRMFSYNRVNILSLYDQDHGRGDGVAIAQHARGLLAEAGLGHASARIRLLCYPRILGYVFNPLSVYFCSDAGGRLGAIIYEVNNTFGERKSYLIAVAADAGRTVHQGCAKEMYVSPFTPAEGRYSFSIRSPADDVLVGVALHDRDGGVMNAVFSGERQPFDAPTLRRMLIGHPLMTLKVIAGIHIEAAKLWAKGVPLVARHSSPAYSFTVVPQDNGQPAAGGRVALIR